MAYCIDLVRLRDGVVHVLTDNGEWWRLKIEPADGMPSLCLIDHGVGGAEFAKRVDNRMRGD